MIEIDGSIGEGGGQVLRSALALSILTQQAMRINAIRARRKKPGLQAQHLKSVQAAAAISGAMVEGAALGSQELTFHPGEVQPGKYHFDIGTAGSTSLVLQTIFLPLAQSGGTSTVTITGGTHVSWSPSFHYLDWQWLPHLNRMGFEASLAMEKAGFYPQGGGKIKAVIHPAGKTSPLDLMERGALTRITGLSAVANLDLEIGKRQKHQALRRLEPICRETKIQTAEVPAPVKGTFIVLLAVFERAQACFTALGAPGKRAEAVADEAVDALLAHLATDGMVDLHLADQLLLPLSFAGGQSQFRTSKVTQHLLTNAAIIQAFLPTNIHIEGEEGQPGAVTISA